jgi:GT2 family glycosyltransferase
MSDPRVALVVLTHNHVAEVTRTVERALALPEQPRIVVVDNGSRDGTAAVLTRRHPEIEVLALPDNRGAAGRNVGVERASRPYVALCDDDTWWAPGALSRGADLLDAHPTLAVVTARVLVGAGARQDPACVLMEQSPLPSRPHLPGMPILGFLAGASIVRRHAFLAAGGFERQLFIGGEEQLLAVDLASAGWAMAYVPDLVVHHHPSPHRDARARRRLLLRNALWLAWLRRPAPRALRRTIELLRLCPIDIDVLVALGEAARGIPWVIRRRRVVSHEVEATLRTLESVDGHRP